MSRYAVAILAVLAACPVRADEKPVEIALKKIWAFRMPGTRDVRKVDSARPQDSLIEPIRQELKPLPANATEPKQAFIVPGSGAEALKGAYEILVAEQDVQNRFSAGQEVSVVFYSHQFDAYVHLHHVERRGKEIIIRYRFTPHVTDEMTEHLALIPLGKLPAGKYDVKVVQSPISKRFLDMGYKAPPRTIASRVVCQSFQFLVKD